MGGFETPQTPSPLGTPLVAGTQCVLRHRMYSELQSGVFLGVQNVVVEVAAANCIVARSVPL